MFKSPSCLDIYCRCRPVKADVPPIFGRTEAAEQHYAIRTMQRPRMVYFRVRFAHFLVKFCSF